jgi:drug/metabolite transporter (DMT)-like permease
MTLVYTALTLIAFASNSLLCRLALGDGTIDAASFTSVRIVSGAVMLLALSAIAARPAASALPSSLSPPPSALATKMSWFRDWRLPLVLFLYAITFSLAYVSLTAGTGALILFAGVQGTMRAAALAAGERPHRSEWIGIACAMIGIVVLTAPGITSPPIVGSLLMAVSGISWGFYSLWGRENTDPLGSTTTNFVGATPLSLLVSLAMYGRVHVTAPGVLLAAASGALSSGVGYVLWYSALPNLTATRAATAQLAVPVIAAVGGVVLLSEQLSLRLAISAVLILGGIGIAIAGRR